MSELSEEWPHELALDDEPGPAAMIARSHADDMILGALDQAGFASERTSGVNRAAYLTPKPGIGSRSLAAAAVLAFLSIGSASAAVMWFGRRPSEPSSQASPAVRELKTSAREAMPVRPSQEATAVAEPAAPQPAAPELKSSPYRSTARAPDDWLSEGNRLRSERRWSKADEAYARATEDAPNSQAAYVARVASAALRLEHLRNPRGALSYYRSALRQSPDGALTEEIYWGIAEAYRALHERAAERWALERFVREFPSSPLIAQARARLD